MPPTGRVIQPFFQPSGDSDFKPCHLLKHDKICSYVHQRNISDDHVEWGFDDDTHEEIYFLQSSSSPMRSISSIQEPKFILEENIVALTSDDFVEESSPCALSKDEYDGDDHTTKPSRETVQTFKNLLQLSSKFRSRSYPHSVESNDSDDDSECNSFLINDTAWADPNTNSRVVTYVYSLSPPTIPVKPCIKSSSSQNIASDSTGAPHSQATSVASSQTGMNLNLNSACPPTFMFRSTPNFLNSSTLAPVTAHRSPSMPKNFKCVSFVPHPGYEKPSGHKTVQQIRLEKQLRLKNIVMDKDISHARKNERRSSLSSTPTMNDLFFSSKGVTATSVHGKYQQVAQNSKKDNCRGIHSSVSPVNSNNNNKHGYYDSHILPGKTTPSRQSSVSSTPHMSSNRSNNSFTPISTVDSTSSKSQSLFKKKRGGWLDSHLVEGNRLSHGKDNFSDLMEAGRVNIR